MNEMRKRKAGFILFKDFEELDLAGPWEVFGTTNVVRPGSMALFAIARTMEPVRGSKGLRLSPDVTFADAPDLDLLIVPGGEGTRKAMQDSTLLEFIRVRYPITEYMASVCTGAFVLAEAGLLDDRQATTHWLYLDRLRAYPAIRVRDDLRFVDAGPVLSSGGVACGIDMALHLVRKIHGEKTAGWVAEAMCYVEPASGK